ncbi:histidine phosphotransferase ChpT [Bosea sp. OAE752]|jgi:histidine phosphotransferase ChpT|uniref:Histidine phosphotransferase n=1 Tax=Bosea spartocytisi TaxID=2773451 RepID=A0A927ECL5_9HYPH|nr:MULTISPECIES: histidine phosphotransferase family protein [Bosea]MBD3848462.1 histidine phosphotransferase [Bosea spartocytisi]MCT4472811.1 histidine phosphotransferase family protein [Bosea spartocytisi]
MTAISLDPLDLAALLCSRVCHDVISPVGAIVNALEVLEEDDPSMRDFALELIKKSARNASARLQFARLAFGAAGSAGAMIDLGDAGNVANGFLNDEKLSLDWEAPRALLPKNQVKLLLNLLLIATQAVPRGGKLVSRAVVEGEQGSFEITATGSHARIPAHVEELIAGRSESGAIDAHAVQPLYAGMVARAAGMAITFAIEGDMVTIKAAKAEA